MRVSICIGGIDRDRQPIRFDRLSILAERKVRVPELALKARQKLARGKRPAKRSAPPLDQVLTRSEP